MAKKESKKDSIKDIISSIIPFMNNLGSSTSDKKESKRFDEAVDLLDSINDKLRRQTSFIDIIKMGIVRGAATAVGATVVAALFLTILSSVVDTVDDVPILRDIIERTEGRTDI